MNVEAELKFRVAPRKLSSVANARLIGARRGGRSEEKLVTTYFDTTKHKQEQEAAMGLLKAARGELQHLRPLTAEPH